MSEDKDQHTYDKVQDALMNEMGRVQNYSAHMTLNEYAALCAADNRKWDFDPVTGEPLEVNRAEKIALMHSELSEMLEAIRKDLMDDKLPHRKGEEVEAADLLIRMFHYAGLFRLDLDGAFWEKRDYNAKRIDHSHAHRAGPNGKKF